MRKELVVTDNSEYEVTETTDSNLFCLWKDNSNFIQLLVILVQMTM